MITKTTTKQFIDTRLQAVRDIGIQPNALDNALIQATAELQNMKNCDGMIQPWFRFKECLKRLEEVDRAGARAKNVN